MPFLYYYKKEVKVSHTCHDGTQAKHRQSSTHSPPQRKMGASGQRHALAILLRQKPLVPTKVEGRWAPEPKIVWGCFNYFRC